MFQSNKELYEFDEFRLDVTERILSRHGERLPLAEKTFETLCSLVKHGNHLVSKEVLINEIWADTIVEENNLEKNISYLRKLLGEKDDKAKFIETVRGHGYRFLAEVREVLEEAELSEPSAVADELPSELQITNYKLQNGNQSEIGNWKVELNKYQKPKTTNRRTIRFLLIALSILAISLSGFYVWRGNIKPAIVPIKSIAVLPFKPLVAEMRDEALEIGMADTLIARLAQNHEIIVRPLSSVRRFGNLEQDAQSAGRELGVESVLDGNVQHWGDKIRVNVRLIKVADGTSIWTGTFDEKVTDLFIVQDAISNKLIAALTLHLNNDEKNYLNNRGTENVEAYRFYLQGRYHALKATPPEIRQGIRFYQQAVDADPLYALAYAGMAQAYAALPITSDVPPNEAFPQAKAAAQRALEIDANLAEAHIISGVVEFWFDWDWTKAETELKKAIAINPNSSDAHRFYAVLLTVLGRSDEAIAEMETARQLDPLSLIGNALKAQAFFYAGRDAEATDQANKTLEIEPNFWIAHIMLTRIYLRENRFDEAASEAIKAEEFSGSNSEAISLLAYALAKLERRDEALEMLKELKSKSNQQYVPAYNVAMIYNGLGDKAETLNHLENAFAGKDARMILLKVEPKWNNLRNEPRFIDLMKRMNFK